MGQVLHRLWLWIWLLIPANPILVRVVQGSSKRTRHLWLRAGYLAALLLVVLFSLILSGNNQSGSLAELAKAASQTFAHTSLTQLALMCFLAPIFTAAAITQERDAQTFNILLSTPLSNSQIVFGSLMSRLYFVIMLLIAGLPIFLMTMAYGGVTTSQVFESFALSGSTAVLTGALAIFVAMRKVGTRGTIFSFFLLIGLYLISLWMLGQWSGTWVEASQPNVAGVQMSWLTPLHPFLALDVALNRIHAPDYARLSEYSSTARFALAYPSAAYVCWTLTLAFLLTLTSVFFVRRSVISGDETFWAKFTDRFRKTSASDRSRKPRSVWANPVAWREARTRGGGSGAFLRWSLIIAGIVGCSALGISHMTGSISADVTRQSLSFIIVVQFAIAIIIATNTAATSMTKERESKTMDILLTTPVTSKYILWGKLRGLVTFAVPLLIGPVLFLLVFSLYGLTQPKTTPAIWIESAVEMAILLIIYTGCACVIGLRISLVTKKTVTAVMYSVGLVIVLSIVASLLGKAIVGGAGGGEVGAFFAPFTPFTAIYYLVDLNNLFDSPKEFTAGVQAARMAGLLGTGIAAVVYSFVVWSVYTGLVRNFDMIVRKQTGL